MTDGVIPSGPSGPDGIALKPRAQVLADYWAKLPKSDLIPHRRDFDPAALTAVLDIFILVEVVTPDHLRIRLAGTTIVENYGREITGLNYLDFRDPSQRPVIGAAMNLVVTHPCGKLVRQCAETGAGQARFSESFGLLLRDDSGDARLILYQVDYGELDDLQTREERFLLAKHTLTRHFFDIGAGVPDFEQVGDVPRP